MWLVFAEEYSHVNRTHFNLNGSLTKVLKECLYKEKPHHFQGPLARTQKDQGLTKISPMNLRFADRAIPSYKPLNTWDVFTLEKKIQL